MFHVRDFRVIGENTNDSGNAIRTAIQAAIASGAVAEVVFDAGTYRVRPETKGGWCFPVTQATNLVIRGTGPTTRIVITDPAAGGFSVELCRQVSIRGFDVDYDPPPFCQGIVKNVDPQAGHFEVEIEPGYPSPDPENFLSAVKPYGKWGMIMDPATRRIRANTLDNYLTPRWQHRQGRIWRFFTDKEYHRLGLQHMRVGDSYVHLARNHKAALYARECDGIRIENMTVHASPGAAVVLVGNQAEIAVRRLDVRFAPGTTRLLTTDADGVHCQRNRSGPIIEDCYFEGMGDDAINIYTLPSILTGVRSPTQWIVAGNQAAYPGDVLQVVSPKTGRLRGVAKIVEVRRARNAALLTLEKPLEGVITGKDHRSADTLYNLGACGSGFQIRRNHMNGNRRYGCLLRAGGGVVENNVFEDTTGAGVVLANDPEWPEGPMPWGITIRSNRFLRGGTCIGYADSPGGAALAVTALRLGYALAEAEGIRDVTIEGNEFVDRAGSAVFVSGAENVKLQANRITAAGAAELRRKGSAIAVEHSSRVVILDNEVLDPRAGTIAAVEIGDGVPPGTAGVRIADLEAKLSPGGKPVTDRRTQ